MSRLMAILSGLRRAARRAGPGLMLLGATLAAPGIAPAQSFEPNGAVCRAPSSFCGRTVQSRCLSALGAGAVPTEVASLECRGQLETYRDCLALVARQCGAGPAAPEATPSPGDATADAPASPTMLAIWREVKDSGDADALDAFADAYPDSPLATLARNRAAGLRAAADAPAAPVVPGAAAGSEGDAARAAAARARNREAQAHLARAGFAPGLADGVWGPRSAAALAAFSRENGLPADGALTEAHLAALRLAPDAPRPAAAPAAAPSDSPPADAPPADARPPNAPIAEAGEATLILVVRYKRGLTFLEKRCRAEVPKADDGAVAVAALPIDCVAPVILSLSMTPEGALSSGSLTFDGLHRASLSGAAGRFEADFGLIGPRDILGIDLAVSD